MIAPRLAATFALAAAAASAALAAYLAWDAFPRSLLVAAAGLLAVFFAWQAVAHPGPERPVAFALSAAAVTATVLLVLAEGRPAWFGVVAGTLLASAAARAAFARPAELPPAPPVSRPALVVNPRSGDGRGKRPALIPAARSRGIRVLELSPGENPGDLARRAADEGADALGMAGGDGSQGAVAAVAAERGLPFVCVPAGTRNHFALDLGVDRDDLLGALDAFGDAGERIVDLAAVNDRIFVNNVSLGIYADAVQREGYRQAKLRTLMSTLAEWSRDGTRMGLRWTGPGGTEHDYGAAVLVSNNRYRLGRVVGSGTRPHIDEGLLGITVAAAPTGESQRRRIQRPWREWTAAEFRVEADEPVPAGVDGEAVVLEPPLRFRAEPRALRVRIARGHPGASPSARVPESPMGFPRALLRIAIGRAPA